MNDPLIVVRLLPGRCRESQRVAHLVPLPAQASDIPDVLHAYCGREIVRDEYELLPGIVGMPCEPCVLRAPMPTTTNALTE
jgi:hypothetical protein